MTETTEQAPFLQRVIEQITVILKRTSSILRDERNGTHANSSGVLRHYRYDQLHRDGDEPAVIGADFRAWYRHGELSRDGDRPVIEREDGSKEWPRPGTDPYLKVFDKNYVTTWIKLPGMTTNRLVLSTEIVPEEILKEVKLVLKQEECRRISEAAKKRKPPVRKTRAEKETEIAAVRAKRKEKREKRRKP